MAEVPQKPTNEHGLTDLQWRFLNEYVVDFNATAAAKRAGIEKHASAQASRLLKTPSVRAALTEMLSERNRRWENTHSRVIQEAIALAFSNMQDYARWDHSGVELIESEKLTRDQAASVMSVEYTDTKHGTTIKIKREPKSKALELLMRNLCMLDPEPANDSNRGAFAKWAEEQRSRAQGESEVVTLKAEIAELREQLVKLTGAAKERSVEDGDGT